METERPRYFADIVTPNILRTNYGIEAEFLITQSGVTDFVSGLDKPENPVFKPK